MPENSKWDFDEQTEVIYKTNDLAEISFVTEGIYTVGIDAQLANVISMSGTKVVYSEGLSGESSYHQNYDLRYVPSGVYFIFIKAGGETRMLRMVLL